ncbi:unnamed protein product [Linum trigynum]|uniref:Uncharacterized protein n=1 Tax=Linum trigynum TaxID=586398 RepID=A0AAV2DK15_9ROSI
MMFSTCHRTVISSAHGRLLPPTSTSTTTPATYTTPTSSDSGRWRGVGIKIGPSADARFRALEVHGVIIKGSRLTQLYNDMTLAASGGQKLYLAANRNGICYLSVNGPYVTRLRVNDYFKWAKYGVKPQISPSTIWNKCDLSSGAILVDIGQLLKNKEKEMQEIVKEKEKEVLVMLKMVERNKEVESLWEKTMEDKDKQLAVLVEKNREVESMWEKSAREKDKQLDKLMDAMRALIYEI